MIICSSLILYLSYRLPTLPNYFFQQIINTSHLKLFLRNSIQFNCIMLANKVLGIYIQALIKTLNSLRIVSNVLFAVITQNSQSHSHHKYNIKLSVFVSIMLLLQSEMWYVTSLPVERILGQDWVFITENKFVRRYNTARGWSTFWTLSDILIIS